MTYRITDPFGMSRPGRLEQLLGDLGLNAPAPRRARGNRTALEIIRGRLGADIPAPHEPSREALFGIPISEDNELEADEIRIEMSDGTERVFRIGVQL